MTKLNIKTNFDMWHDIGLTCGFFLNLKKLT